jgi:hypothetical protein
MRNYGAGRWLASQTEPSSPQTCPRTTHSKPKRLPGYETGVRTLSRLTEMRGIS